jgi:hypothetical protein
MKVVSLNKILHQQFKQQNDWYASEKKYQCIFLLKGKGKVVPVL